MNKDQTRVCSGCDKAIINNSFMKCSNKRCKKLYEIDCLAFQQEQFNKLTQEYKDVWVCPDCVFAHITYVNLNTLFSLPGPHNYNLASPDIRGQSRTIQKEEDEGKLQKEFTALRSEIMSRFDRIETQFASRPNILIEELCFLNKAGQSDLYTRIRNLEEKITSVHNTLTGNMNQLTSRVMLLESFMGTIQRQLMEMDIKKQSYVNVSSSVSRSDKHISPKTSESGVIKSGEKLQDENNKLMAAAVEVGRAAAVEMGGGKKDKKKGGKVQLENWTMHLL